METLFSEERKPIETLWKEDIDASSLPILVLYMLRDNFRHCKRIMLFHSSECDRRLLYQKRLVVPNYRKLQLYFMQIKYNSSAAGHLDRSKTMEWIRK